LGVPEREGGEDFGVEGVFIGDEDEGVCRRGGATRREESKGSRKARARAPCSRGVCW
jgi:hypothetical protein